MSQFCNIFRMPNLVDREKFTQTENIFKCLGNFIGVSLPRDYAF